MVRLAFRTLKETRWYEYLVRFAFGGLMTVAAGLVAKEWGGIVGGLFLAFPAIFPAAATLVEKHERDRKVRKNQAGRKRGRMAAAIDSAGASLGVLALAGFGLVVWGLAGRLRPWLVLAAATAAWILGSFLLWMLKRRVL